MSGFTRLSGIEKFFLYSAVIAGIVSCGAPKDQESSRESAAEIPKPVYWHAPDTSTIPKNADGDLIRYGRDLIVRTAFYLGPKGVVENISNGMNCQNCHLEAGTKPFGNNYGSVASTYPKFRQRSASLESIERRINDCLERSLNGRPLDSLSREMRAMVAYIHWLGKDVPRNRIAVGSGLADLPYLNRAADPVRGKKLFMEKCRVCHGTSGEGLKLRPADAHYIYPPLCGENSFNTGAGLYRISNFAKYIRANMPQPATYDKPVLAEDEAWDIAAFVLSLPRPEKKFVKDWPKIELKPIDHPFGPYIDSFSAEQHKYGPFLPMLETAKSKSK
jgi:thiosulfate dehydrogenase